MARRSSVLFLCTGNSARSQMAEVLLRYYAGQRFEVFSAGSKPQEIHSDVYRVLLPFGVQPGELRSKSIEVFAGKRFDYVISLCDKALNECRRFDQGLIKQEWSFQDPYQRTGLNPFETTLAEIEQRIKSFILLESGSAEEVDSDAPIGFFKTLSDPLRLQILMLILYEGELCVCELMAALEDSQPKVSRHLALLRESGLLSDRRQGQWVFYRIHPELPSWMKDVLRETTDNNVTLLKTGILKLREMKRRPQKQAVCV